MKGAWLAAELAASAVVPAKASDLIGQAPRH
jgi:hypothetical protein